MDQSNAAPVRAFAIDETENGMESLGMLLRVGLPCEVTIGLDCEVTLFPNGPSCVEAIRSWPPDLVFLDLAMPDMNGFRIIESLQSLDLRSTLFVALADYPSEYYEKECRDAGFHYYEPKPIDPDRLRIIVGDARRQSADSAPESVFDVSA
jgi:CheY-like chemotaxis protein